MFEPRSPLDSELNQVYQFLNEHLRPQSSWKIEQEYPIALSTKNTNNIKIIKDEDTGVILSHAVFKVHILKTPVGIFKVAAIGSVVTHKDYRRQGLSQKILQSTLDDAKKQGCDMAILWSDLYDFYKKLNFELVGSEISFLIDKELPVQEKNHTILEGTKISPQALLNLYTHHTVGAVRTYRDINDYLKIPNSRVYTAWSKDNQLMAYAVEGKGEDLQNYIHEWGGKVSDIMYLLNAIYKKDHVAKTIIIPFHSKNLIQKFEEQNLKRFNGYLGLVKLLLPENLIPKINRYALSQGEDSFRMNFVNGLYSWVVKDRVYSTDSDQDILRLIFGPQKASDLAQFDVDTQQTLEKLFPIPLWLWGWDSI